MRIKVDKDEFIEWVMSQPDDRPVNFTDDAASDECGCPMVQYGKEALGLKGEFYVSFTTWYNRKGEAVASSDCNIYSLIRTPTLSCTTYGKIKDYIKLGE